MSAHHLAQLNIAVPRFPVDDPRMDGFTSMLDMINSLADTSPGFVWRLVSEGANDATALRARLDGADQMVNMSVWESQEALWEYVYRSAHLDFLRRRGDWFDKPAGTSLVLWWVPAGHIPTIDEGFDRLNALRRHGPNPEAFTLRHHFDAPDRSRPDPQRGPRAARSLGQPAAGAPGIQRTLRSDHTARLRKATHGGGVATSAGRSTWPPRDRRRRGALANPRCAPPD